MRALQVVYLRDCAGLFRCETPYDFENFRLVGLFVAFSLSFKPKLFESRLNGQSDGGGGLGGNNAVLLERA